MFDFKKLCDEYEALSPVEGGLLLTESSVRTLARLREMEIPDFPPVETLAAEAPESFDVVTCMEMLEHVPDPGSVVQACQRLVKPGGMVFFSTINRNPKSFLFAIVGAEYVLNLLPRGTHEWKKFMRPSELARCCRDAGLEIAQSRGMEYNPFTKRYWLSDDTSVNYMFATRKAA